MLWQARAGSAEADASATSMPSAPTGGSAPSAAAPTGTTPKLNAAQADALRAVGIDPAKLPTTITPAQEGCFTSILGAARVAEIKAGRAPTTEEIFAARTCLE